MPFLPPNQQRQSTEGNNNNINNNNKIYVKITAISDMIWLVLAFAKMFNF